MDGEDYKLLLLTAAIDLKTRFGWTCIPIRYADDDVLPPRGWQSWAESKPTICEIRSYFLAHWDKLDAIAAAIQSTGCVFVDCDNLKHKSKLSKIVRKSAQYRTSRGIQFIVANSEIASVRNLRNAGFDGEVRAGWNLSILPPSRHRTQKRFTYKWVSSPDEIASVKLSQFFMDRAVSKALSSSSKTTSHTLYSPPRTCPATAQPATTVEASEVSVEMAISRSLPASLGDRLKMLPKLVQLLKRIKTHWSDDELERIGKRYITLARASKTTRERGSSKTVSAIKHLMNTFDDSRGLPINGDLVKSSEPVRSAASLISATKNKEFNTMAIVKLATLCRDLATGRESFFIGLRDAGAHIGATPKHVSRLFEKLIDGGYLLRIDAGTPGVSINRKAATYQWIFDKKESVNEYGETGDARSFAVAC